MKTNIFKLTMLLLCLGAFMTTQAQSLFNLSPNQDDDTRPLKWTSAQDTYADYDDNVYWADYTVGGGVGFGWSDNDGNSATSFCVGAEFLAKVLGDDQNPKGAGYFGAFGTYHNASSESVDESLIKAGVKFSYFDRLTARNEIQLIYGAKASYETGTLDFSGFKEDVTGYAFNAYTGVNFWLNNKMSVGFEVPLLTYASKTFSANGSDFKADTFSAAINKDNPISATVRWNIAQQMKFGGKDTDGDGIYDQDDECPKTPGLDAFNGCPDSDGDGIADHKDSCPNEAGTADNDGCPNSN